MNKDTNTNSDKNLYILQNKVTKMENLRLINNSGIQQEKNICFVNSSLQLLHSLPEVRNFLSNEEYKINEHINSPICNEMSSIFKTAGKFIASAATLRYLVGERSGNADIKNGTQQDMTHFLRLLLHQIEIELSQCPGEASLFINKFWGVEFFYKKFGNSTDGKCAKCGTLPRQENQPDFEFLDISNRNGVLGGINILGLTNLRFNQICGVIHF